MENEQPVLAPEDIRKLYYTPYGSHAPKPLAPLTEVEEIATNFDLMVDGKPEEGGILRIAAVAIDKGGNRLLFNKRLVAVIRNPSLSFTMIVFQKETGELSHRIFRKSHETHVLGINYKPI